MPRQAIRDVRCIEARPGHQLGWAVDVRAGGRWIRVAEKLRVIDGVAIAGLLAEELDLLFDPPSLHGWTDADYEQPWQLDQGD